MTYVDQLYQRAAAFLLGRRTYEMFAPHWGAMANSASPIAAALNTRPKYVASATLTNPTWADTTVLSGDVAAAIRELKNKTGGELQVHGSGALTRWLLDNHLVDEINLLVCPVVVGQGERLFPEHGLDMALDLADSRAYPAGITLQVYPARRAPAVRDGRAERAGRAWVGSGRMKGSRTRGRQACGSACSTPGRARSANAIA